MTVEVITFGCRLNQNESAVIKKQAEAANIVNTVILNSCAVTSEAERQLRQSIRKIRKNNPEKTIIVTGCAAQINSERYSNMPEVDKVIGNTEKMLAETYTALSLTDSEKILVNDIMSIQETAHYIPDVIEDRVRAFMQVQNGCNHRCTFCIIPYGRGNSRSVPLGEIVENAKSLVSKGFKEIVLTGVDITDYGLDLPGQPSLTQMIKRLLTNVPELPRLRLSSIDVAELKDDFLELLATEERLMPHLHLSLQSGDDMILKRMKRRHLSNDIISFCNKARAARPQVEFGADIIAGFPTETDQMFENTLNLINGLKIGHLHIFPYSERDGTPAAKMPQIDKRIRKERASILRVAGEKILHEIYRNKIGQSTYALIEGTKIGRAEDFTPIRFIGSVGHNVGDIVQCKITGFEDGMAVCTVA